MWLFCMLTPFCVRPWIGSRRDDRQYESHPAVASNYESNKNKEETRCDFLQVYRSIDDDREKLAKLLLVESHPPCVARVILFFIFWDNDGDDKIDDKSYFSEIIPMQLTLIFPPLTCFSFPLVAGLEPDFVIPLENVTVAQGRDASFTCVVNNLGGYRVSGEPSKARVCIGLLEIFYE